MGVTEQFGLYDIAAHGIPGVVVLAAGAWAAGAWGAPPPSLDNELLAATLGGVAAYVVGVLCQELAGMRDGVLVKGRAWADLSQEAGFLAPQPKREAEAFRALLVPAIAARTGLDPDAPPAKTAPPKWHGVCFRACYAVVHQEGEPARAQMFKAISAFHESMAVAALLAAAAALAVLVRAPAPLGALVLVAAAGAFLAFRRAYQSFDRRFVTEVYHAFYAVARRPSS